MPVTVRPSAKTAESWGNGERSPGRDSYPDVRFIHATSAEQLLASTTSNDNEKHYYSYDRSEEIGLGRGRGRTPLATRTSRDNAPQSSTVTTTRARRKEIPHLIQTSFTHLDRASSTTFATKNGFVHACIEAYNEHHNLVLRPEDVWFAILTQLSAYTNAHADELKSHFVTLGEQQEKKALHIETDISSPNFDHGETAYQMTKLISENLVDPSLREWVLPTFSTTTRDDQATASILFMGTLQKYFTYSWGTRCGIPSVTLLGEIDDWIEIAQRCASHLATGRFGSGPMVWYTKILRPILLGFIETFRDPEGHDARRFWRGICDRHEPDGSGKVTYSGWVTGFCYWDEGGACLFDIKGRKGVGGIGRGGGVELERGEVPAGFVKVPVTLWDDGVRVETEMVGGSVGIRVLKGESVAEEGGESPRGLMDGVEGEESVILASPMSFSGSPTAMSWVNNGNNGGGGDRGSGSRRGSTGSSLGRGRRWEGHDTIQPESGWFMYRV